METEQSIQSRPLIVRGRRDWTCDGFVEIRSPWDHELIGRVPLMSAADVRECLDWQAKRIDRCAAWPFADRLALVSQWADLLDRHRDEIAMIETLEVGKPIRQTRRISAGIVSRIRSLCRAAQSLVPSCANTSTNAVSRQVLSIALREPLGLVAGILPFNSPVSAAVWKIAPALLMGNAVVVKLSEQAPLTALRAAQVLAEMDGLPEGALQVINGIGSEVGPALASHPAVRMISFTGGSPAGVDIYRRSADTMKRLVLECGSNDPLLVLADADISGAAKAAADGGLRTYCGQICTAPKRCIVHEQVFSDFVEALKSEAAAVVVGDPRRETTELGPLINRDAATRVEKQISEAVSAGATLVIGGKIIEGALFPPTILSEVRRDNPIFIEPAFGPVVSVIRATSDDQAIELAGDSRYALRAGIFSRDVQRAMQLARRLDFGAVAINGCGIFDHPDLSVDPRKLSGVGSEGVQASLLQHSQPKYLWVNGFWGGA